MSNRHALFHQAPARKRPPPEEFHAGAIKEPFQENAFCEKIGVIRVIRMCALLLFKSSWPSCPSCALCAARIRCTAHMQCACVHACVRALIDLGVRRLPMIWHVFMSCHAMPIFAQLLALFRTSTAWKQLQGSTKSWLLPHTATLIPPIASRLANQLTRKRCVCFCLCGWVGECVDAFLCRACKRTGRHFEPF